MIFLQGQSLDNVSPDPFVLNGHTLPGSDERVQTALAASSAIRISGYASLAGQTEVARYHDRVAIKIRTHQSDGTHRPSPILATVTWADLAHDIPGLVQKLAEDAKHVDRTFDSQRLIRELEEWMHSAKSRRRAGKRVGAVLGLIAWRANRS